MLWSLLKVILFVVLVAASIWGATWLLQLDGGVTISAGREYQLTPLEMVIAGVVLLGLLFIVLKIVGFLVAVLRFFNGDETAISRYFDRNRERKGYQALADGMTALASGESRKALNRANRAEGYLRRPDLTNLLTAQAAEMAGDSRKAEETYKRMLGDDRTRFVGVRGIMNQKLAAGETDTALALAQKAFALRPKHEEVQDALLQLQADKGDWKGARETLGTKLKQGSLPRDVFRRRDAVLAVSEAGDVIGSDEPSPEAQEAAIEANRLSPDLVPAAAMAARSYIAQGKSKLAARVIKKAWEVAPHPDLAAAFAEIEPDETPDERIKRFATLTRLHKDDPETKMLLAELHIAAEDFPGARRAMGDLVGDDPTARALTIMAAIERGEGGDDKVVRGYLSSALTASRGPQWVCDKCSLVQSTWSATCNNCSGLDVFSWRKPALAENASDASAGMLPILVGQDEEAASDTEKETAKADGGEQVPDAEVVEEPADEKQ
ncbi:MAG: heme biosynthesis HemY N-terminal domain-containing protein [Pseudomonadota bacterium]